MNPRLENWFITDYDLIMGEIYGHPTIPDGETVRTSRVVYLDTDSGDAITKNTHYILGKRFEQ